MFFLYLLLPKKIMFCINVTLYFGAIVRKKTLHSQPKCLELEQPKHQWVLWETHKVCKITTHIDVCNVKYQLHISCTSPVHCATHRYIFTFCILWSHTLHRLRSRSGAILSTSVTMTLMTDAAKEGN